MKALAGALLLIPLLGCSWNERDPEAYSPAIGSKTQTQKDLEALPPPVEAATVSVYRFEEQNGQSKVAQSSRTGPVVGGLSILKKALFDCGGASWFRVLDREGLDALLQERKVIKTIQEEYVAENKKPLSTLAPLLSSGLLLEGEIVSSESSVMTGGTGARYLRLNGSTEYRRDVVTVYLRGLSVTSGEILLAVNAEKAIFSTPVGGGIFHYVSFDKIIPGEDGYTVNEPQQLAMRQAIELAVYSMVIEGARRGLWRFADARAGSRLIEDYSRKFGSSSPKAVQTARAALAAPPKPITAEPAVQEPSPYEFSYTIRSGAATSRAETKPEPTKSALSVKDGDKPGPEPSEARPHRAAVTDEDPLPRGFYVQIRAMFPQEAGQKHPEMIDALKRLGYSVVIQRARLESVTLHRILVGPFKSRDEALSEIPLIKEFAPSQDEPFIKTVS